MIFFSFKSTPEFEISKNRPKIPIFRLENVKLIIRPSNFKTKQLKKLQVTVSYSTTYLQMWKISLYQHYNFYLFIGYQLAYFTDIGLAQHNTFCDISLSLDTFYLSYIIASRALQLLNFNWCVYKMRITYIIYAQDMLSFIFIPLHKIIQKYEE